MKARTAGLVAAAWILIGIVEGAQSAFGASLQGRALTLGAALRASLVQTVPWIPITLAVIALAVRFPLSRSNWRSRMGIHLTGALVVAFAANLLTVLGFWLIAGRWDGLGTLALQASRWTLMRVH
ncbi:MAG: hypothetical protein ACREA0_11445, partial [bacterium]